MHSEAFYQVDNLAGLALLAIASVIVFVWLIRMQGRVS